MTEKHIEQLQELQNLGRGVYSNQNPRAILADLLERSVRHHYIEAVSFLLDSGGCPNGAPNQEIDLLTNALLDRSANFEMAELLLSKGADVNHKNELGRTPLHAMVIEDRFESCKWLVLNGADTNAQNDKKETPLMVLFDCFFETRNNAEKIFHLLIEAGTNLMMKNQWGDTALHLVATKGSAKYIKMLVKAGMDPNITTIGAGTPLHQAAKFNCMEAAQALIDAGADVNRCVLPAEQPVLDAIKNNQEELAWELRSQGVEAAGDFMTPYEFLDGYTPLDLAKKHSNQEIIELLKKHGAKK